MLKPGLNLKGNISLKNPKTWLLMIAAAYVIIYVVTAIIRISYPYEIEWMEGSIVDHVRWIADGNPLYSEPTLEYTPYIYPPLYFYASALLMKIFGGGLAVTRLVSFFSILGIFLLIWKLVFKETRSYFYAGISVGFFAASYGVAGYYYDVGRIDPIFVFFLFWSVYLLRISNSPKSKYIYLSAIVLCLACYAKQQTIPIALLIIFSLVFDNRVKLVKFFLTFIISFALLFFYLQLTSDGWFSFYVFKIPYALEEGSKGFSRLNLGNVFKDVIIGLPVLMFYLPYMFFTKPGTWKEWGQKHSLYLAFLLGILATSWVSVAHGGGANNVLIPLIGCVIVLGAIALHRIENDLKPTQLHKKGKFFVLFMILLQFIILYENPGNSVPQKAAYEFNEKYIQLLKSIEGEVLTPITGYIPTLAGKKSYAHYMAVMDFYRVKHESIQAVRKKIDRAYRRAVRKKKFAAIIIAGQHIYLNKMHGLYRLKSQLKCPKNLYLTGYVPKRLSIFVPK